MAYIQSSGGDPIAPDTIQQLAALAGFAIPAEDLDALSTALRDQLASIARIDALDLSGVGPVHRFDARWHD